MTKPKCTCRIVYHKLNHPTIDFCPFHKAADQMWEALKHIAETTDCSGQHAYAHPVLQRLAKVALRAAGGKL